MAFESFGDWVAHLARAGELIRFTQPIATELEITEFADREIEAAKKKSDLATLVFQREFVFTAELI